MPRKKCPAAQIFQSEFPVPLVKLAVRYWRETAAPKVALRYTEVAGTDMINGNCVTRIEATNLSRLMAAAAYT